MECTKLLSPRHTITLLHALFAATVVPRVALPDIFMKSHLMHSRSHKTPVLATCGTLAGLRVGCVVFMVLLTGCGNDFSDLDRYIAEVKARPKEPVKPLPEIKVIEPFLFKPEGLRDPFKPLVQPEQVDGTDVSTGSGIKPDTARRKEELEAFPLDGLRMVGTVDMKSSLWGLVKASDGTIYRVKVGNYMGQNYGKIIRIVSDKIELMEIVPDKPGTWREQPASLALTE